MSYSLGLSIVSAIAFVASVSCAAAAQDATEPTDEIVSFFERVCFENVADLGGVSELALAEEWSIHDPSNVPGRDAVVTRLNEDARLVSTERSSAWSTTVAGFEVVIALTEANRLERPTCEVNAAVQSDARSIDQVQVNDRLLTLDRNGTFDRSETRPAVSFPNRHTEIYFSRETLRSAAGQREPALAVAYTVETEGNRVLHNITLYGERMQ